MRILSSIVFVVLSLGACVTEDDTPPMPVDEDKPDAGQVGEPDRVPVDPKGDSPDPDNTDCANATGKPTGDGGCTP